MSDKATGIALIGEGVAEGMPWVKGTCPACGSKSLFVGYGGYITCSYLPCPEPGAASRVLGA